MNAGVQVIPQALPTDLFQWPQAPDFAPPRESTVCAQRDLPTRYPVNPRRMARNFGPVYQQYYNDRGDYSFGLSRLRELKGYQIEEKYRNRDGLVTARARDTFNDRQVVLKTFIGGGPDDELHRIRLLHEMFILSQFNDPRIVRMIDYGLFEGNPTAVLEYHPRGNLTLWAKKRRPQETDDLSYQIEVVELMIKMLKSLSRFHTGGFYHGDVNPWNFVINQNGIPVLIDFGMSILQGQTNPFVESGFISGKPRYMSSQLLNGNTRTLDDEFYALGCILYYLLTSHDPYDDCNEYDLWTLESVKRQGSLELDKREPHSHPTLRAIIQKATHYILRLRYQTHKEMHDDLNACLRTLKREKKNAA